MAGTQDLERIRVALEGGEFFLLYQPIVALATRRCVGGEALIRWRHGDSVVVGAAEFIPHTEGTPLSGPITYWVIDTVARELAEWLHANEEAVIAINVPPEILGRGGIAYAAEKSGLHQLARQIVLEITERGVPDQLGLEALNALPSTGARVALDDVTLSGANLALLTRCHFDFVKIDSSLVQQVTDTGQPEWLEALSGLIAKTSLQVIAEGVQNERQARALAEAGVALGQGHHFAPPLTAAELKGYYAESHRRLVAP